jgi:hypothetical protein
MWLPSIHRKTGRLDAKEGSASRRKPHSPLSEGMGIIAYIIPQRVRYDLTGLSRHQLYPKYSARRHGRQQRTRFQGYIHGSQRGTASSNKCQFHVSMSWHSFA